MWIYCNKNRSYSWTYNSFFIKHPIVESKHLNYLNFKIAAIIIKNKEHLNTDRKGLEQLLVKKKQKKIWINTVMRQARSSFDRKRRSEPSSSFIINNLISHCLFCWFLLTHPWVTGVVKKQKVKKKGQHSVGVRIDLI